MIILLYFFSSCSKDKTPLNITLYNKPLNIIQNYTKGDWLLQYVKGGFCSTCVYPETHNSYMNLTTNKIVIGNDSAGILVDTIVTWRKVSTNSGTTYLLSYYWSPGYGPYAYNFLINEIKNDTLIISDYTSDPAYYYYIKD